MAASGLQARGVLVEAVTPHENTGRRSDNVTRWPPSARPQRGSSRQRGSQPRPSSLNITMRYFHPKDNLIYKRTGARFRPRRRPPH